MGFGARAAPAISRRGGRHTLSAETAPLWPALHAAASAGAAASEPAVVPVAGPAAQPALLPSPADRTREASTGAALAPAVLMAAPPIGADRVIRLPQNSSWADALRTEAAEREASELAAAASARRRAGNKLLWPAERAASCTSPTGKTRRTTMKATLDPVTACPAPLRRHGVPTTASPTGTQSAAAVRARVRTFDVDGRGGAGWHRLSSAAAMWRSDRTITCRPPARRFRRCSQKMPMAALCDSNTTAELPAAPEPVVSLLLPSAALHGVVCVADSERRPSSRAGDEIEAVQSRNCSTPRVGQEARSRGDKVSSNDFSCQHQRHTYSAAWLSSTIVPAEYRYLIPAT